MDRLSRIVERARIVEAEPVRAPLPKPDPAAIADALIAKGRLAAAARRARTEESTMMGWEAEMHEGETLVEAMSRVIAENAPPPIQIVHPVNLMRLREQFCALPKTEQEDEIERHRWYRAGEGRVKTHFSHLLDAMGVA